MSCSEMKKIDNSITWCSTSELSCHYSNWISKEHTHLFSLVLSVVREALHSAAFPWGNGHRRTSLINGRTGHNDDEDHCLVAAGVQVHRGLQTYQTYQAYC